MWSRIALAAFLLSLLVRPSTAALIPPGYFDSVVAIGFVKTTTETGKQPVSEWVTIGTGFFYGSKIKDDPDPKKRFYEIYLVTARHVVEPFVKSGQGDLQVRVNPKEGSQRVKEFTIPTSPKPGDISWYFPKDSAIDVAVVRVNFNLLADQGFNATFIEGDENAATISKMKDIGVSEGDGIFLVGFPLNMAGVDRSYTIVRQGIVARIAELLNGGSRSFLLDSFVFPGNSGGPVFLKPEFAAIEGTKANARALLIGLVLSYRTYNDVAVSKQTGQDRIVFQENTGLAEVLPVDQIDAAIVGWREAHPPMANPVPVFPSIPPVAPLGSPQVPESK